VSTRTETNSSDLAERRANVESALASFRMEGLEPDRETRAILENFTAGGMTLEEMGFAIEARVKQMNVKAAISGAA
jgi:hypothetical protein